MQIQKSIDGEQGRVKNTSSTSVSALAIGQKLDAMVMTSALTAQIVTVKVADSLIDIRSPRPLQQGQKIQLEVVEEGGKAVLKLVSTPAVNKVLDVAPLKVGQQVAVEVVKVLAGDRLLVETRLPASQKQTFDVDVSQLTKQPKITDKLMMNVVMTKPLVVQIMTEKQSNEQMIADRIKQLLPQLPSKPELNNLAAALKTPPLSSAVKQEVQNVLQNIVNKSDVNKPQALKSALQSSGSFTEKHVLTQPESVAKDFKANLLKLVKAVEGELTQKTAIRTTQEAQVMPAVMKLTSLSQAMSLAQVLARQVSLEHVANILTPQSSINAKNILLSPQLVTQLQTGSSPSMAAEFARNMPLEQLMLQGLLKEAEGMHTKLQLNQMAMLREPEPSISASWVLDLPLKDKSSVDMLQFQIDQHKKNNESDDEVWSVKLRLDTQNLGPVQATVTMNDDDVKIVLRAEKESSTVLLDENLDILQHALSKLAVSVSHISCCCGDIDKAILKEANVVASDTLVDVSV